MIKPFPKPSHLEHRKVRLPSRKRVTIALGILATGGAVVAADRQETSGNFKASMGKIQAQWVSNRGTLVLSGAGNGPYIDSLTIDLMEWFKRQSKDKVQFGASDVEDEVRRQHKKFYRENVLPASQWAQNDVPDYELLIAYGSSRGENTLWTTHKLAALKESEFAAVGLGATAAKAMLQRLGFPFLNLEIAATLAVYVVYQVKRTVDLVGLETDVFVIQNSVPLLVSRDDVNEMEARFESYGSIERDSLYYCLGGDLADRERTLGRKSGGLNRDKKALRKFFVEWNEKRRAHFPVNKPPLSLPISKPSASQKSKDQQ